MPQWKLILVSMVTEFCPREVTGGILWPRTVQGTPAMAPCRDGGDRFREGPMVTRSCLGNGEWAEADLTRCTLDMSDGSFLLLWFVIEADEISNTQRTNLEANVCWSQTLNFELVHYSQHCCHSFLCSDETATEHAWCAVHKSDSAVSVYCKCGSNLSSNIAHQHLCTKQRATQSICRLYYQWPSECGWVCCSEWK